MEGGRDSNTSVQRREGDGNVCESDRGRQMVFYTGALMEFSSALITAGSILAQFKQIEGIVNAACFIMCVINLTTNSATLQYFREIVTVLPNKTDFGSKGLRVTR